VHKVIPSKPTFNDLIEEIKAYKQLDSITYSEREELSFLLCKARACQYLCVVPSKLCSFTTRFAFYILGLIFLSSFIYNTNPNLQTYFYITLGLNIFSNVVLRNVNNWKNEEKRHHNTVIRIARICQDNFMKKH